MKVEVECPYCYAVYDIETNGCDEFECVCESTLSVVYDEFGEMYIVGD